MAKSLEECETEIKELIQELTEQLTLSRNMYDELFDSQKRDRADYEAKIKELQEALCWYAEGRNLHVEWSGETQIRDRGEHARTVLMNFGVKT